MLIKIIATAVKGIFELSLNAEKEVHADSDKNSLFLISQIYLSITLKVENSSEKGNLLQTNLKIKKISSAERSFYGISARSQKSRSKNCSENMTKKKKSDIFVFRRICSQRIWKQTGIARVHILFSFGIVFIHLLLTFMYIFSLLFSTN